MDDQNDHLGTGNVQQYSCKRAASDMLEDALQHFDNIIDGTGNASEVDAKFSVKGSHALATDFSSGLEGVALLMEDLRSAVEATVDAEIDDSSSKADFRDSLLQLLMPETLLFYRHLLKLQDGSSAEAFNRLQHEKDSLSLQVSVLSDQVDFQSEKMRELECQLKEAHDRLEGADARLQEEVAAKTTLETQKLQLLNEVSNYKISLVQKQRQGEVDMADVQRQITESEARSDQYKHLVELLQQEITEKNKVVEQLRQQLLAVASNVANAVTSPDEGIVSDDVDKDSCLTQMRMPSPYATSTPIATDAGENGRKRNEVNKEEIEREKNYPQGHPENLSVDETKDGENPTAEISLPSSMAGPDKLRSSPSSSFKSSPQPSRCTKSSSTPNLAMTEIRHVPLTHEATPTRSDPRTSPFHQRKKHGFRKFFTSFKLRRSRSTSLEPRDNDEAPIDEDNFQRGGVRATAGPRLGWNPRAVSSQPQSGYNLPFQHWDTEKVCQWLVDIGLSGYVSTCKKWARNGDTLLRATNHDIEKELGVKNSLHKKKLMLHLQSLAGASDEDMLETSQMDAVWVARWLDDIGLPQYKDTFHEACMDGLTLHHLTVGDAHKLKITNLFHLLSLRRGIEKLRACRFDPSQLRRRPLVEGEDDDDISLWTNHRVMEWLRSVDLAEYAPNLRGSGVHGALMVLEPFFTAETMAFLLNIPNTKSLLRRHLAAKLDELLPEDSVQMKRVKAQESGYQPLNVSVKFKVGRRSFGGFGRLRTTATATSAREFGSSEYVCPMPSSKTMSQHRDVLETRMQWSSDGGESPDQPPVLELNEKATREINAYSSEIASLTSKWSQD